MTLTNEQRAKQAAGKAAAALIQEGMVIGLGTGSTAACFISSLIERFKEGLKISVIATSKRSEQQAKEGGIPILDINNLTSLDLVVDGADEITRQKQMIKGGGGALLREKIIANMAQEMMVIIDEGKLVERLGAFPLALEVVPFAHEVTLYNIQQQGYTGTFRSQPDDSLYITDNGNYIIDITFKKLLSTPEKDHATLSAIPGVIETGFFFNLAGRVLIGHADGAVDMF